MVTSIKNLLLNSNEKLLVYIHIPFCKTKCYYCYYFSSPNHNEEYQRRYIRKVIWELEYYREIFKKRRSDIVAIYIGGGTPSELTKGNLILLLSSINKIISLSTLPNLVQFTMELNPSVVGQKECDEKMSIMRKYSVNRVSFGAQAFDDEVLKRNNCSHSTAQIYKAALLAEGHNFSYNLDMMFGLLGQTFESSIESILSAVEIMPPQIQLNSPIFYVKDSPLVKQTKCSREGPLTPEHQRLLVSLCRILLLKLRYGHTPYFAGSELSLKKKDLNIFAYLQWSGLSDVLGIGCSARSIALKDNLIFQNICDTEEYLKNNSHFKVEKINCDYSQLLKSGVVRYFFKNRLDLPSFRNCSKEKLFNLSKKSNLYIFLILKGIEMEVIKEPLPSRFYYSEAIRVYPSKSLAYFCLTDLLLRNRMYRQARNYIHLFPKNGNSGKLLSMLFLMAKRLNHYEKREIEDMKELLKEKLSEAGIDYRRLNINEYHYKDPQLPRVYLLELLVKYHTFWKRVGGDIQPKEYFKIWKRRYI